MTLKLTLYSLMLDALKNHGICTTSTHIILTTESDIKDAVGEKKAVQGADVTLSSKWWNWDWNPGHPARELYF